MIALERQPDRAGLLQPSICDNDGSRKLNKQQIAAPRSKLGQSCRRRDHLLLRRLSCKHPVALVGRPHHIACYKPSTVTVSSQSPQWLASEVRGALIRLGRQQARAVEADWAWRQMAGPLCGCVMRFRAIEFYPVPPSTVAAEP